MLHEFLTQIQNEQPLQFPNSLNGVYSKVIREVKQKFRNLDQYPFSSLDDDSPEGVAYQLYRFFPTHFFKFFQALTITEQKSLKERGETDVLSWSSVTLVDIGCGAGAASVALLVLLQRYQQFLIDNDKPISPIRVFLIGFEPSDNMLELYSQMVGEFAKTLSPWLIYVRHEKLFAPFPQGVKQLTRMFQPINPHFVLLGMSNVIRPLSHCFDTGKTKWFEKINRALRGQPDCQPEFGEAEASAIKSILEDWQLDRLALLSVATRDKKNPTLWRDNLEQMTKAIRGLVSPHVSTGQGIQTRTGLFEKTRSSLKHTSKTFKPTYYFDYSEFANESYVQDKQWRSVMALENLKLAWARARRYALHEVLSDEIEIFLFDYEVEEKIRRLRSQLLAQTWKALNVEHTLFFDAPKKPGEPRPKTVNRIEEQILASAIIQSPDVHKPQSIASYSYHLNEKSDEFLYKYWLKLWKDFLNHTHKIAKSSNILRSDVKGFYQNIDQTDLIDIARRVLGLGERTEQLLRKILSRDCGARHKPGNGLPQGHVASGFWADLYLAQLDKTFSNSKEFPGVKFARYADDMVFAIDAEASSTDRVKLWLQLGLEELGLEPSDDKTFPQGGNQYISESALDERLEKLSEKFDSLVKEVYKLNNQYHDLYEQEPWKFVAKYLNLLKLIPIHLSVPWLRRKLEQYSPHPWLRLSESFTDTFSAFFSLVFGDPLTSKLKFPPFPSSPEAENEWLQEFQERNASWNRELGQLRSDLVELCKTSIDILSTMAAPEPNLDKIWQEVLAHIQVPATQHLLRQKGRLLAIENQVARVGITSQALLEKAQPKLSHIEAAFQQVIKSKVRVSLEVAVPSKIEAMPSNEPPVPAMKVIEQTSTVPDGSVPSTETTPSTPTLTDAERNKARRRLKFAASRLCMLGLNEVADLLATEIIQRPWQVPVNFLCQGLTDCGRADLLIQILDKSDSAYVKALAIRALAETHPRPSAQEIKRMWAMLQNERAKPYEKLKASEALLSADKWETADITTCKQLIDKEKDPYLLKNYVLMIGQIGLAIGNSVRDYLESLQEKCFREYIQCLEGECLQHNCHNLIVIDAIQYVLRSPNQSLLSQNEPELLRSYYSKNYPVVESDTMIGNFSNP